MINQYDLTESKNVTLECYHYFFNTLLHTGEIPDKLVRGLHVYTFCETNNEMYYYRCRNTEAEHEFVHVYAKNEWVHEADRISEDIQDLFDRVRESEECMKK